MELTDEISLLSKEQVPSLVENKKLMLFITFLKVFKRGLINLSYLCYN